MVGWLIGGRVQSTEYTKGGFGFRMVFGERGLKRAGYGSDRIRLEQKPITRTSRLKGT